MRVVLRRGLSVLGMAVAAAAWAQDQPATASQGAMLAGKGNVTVNGQIARSSQALFPGDLVVVPAEGGGNITLDGTSLVATGDTAARYEGTGVTLERGSISVGTQKGFVVRTGCLIVAPTEPNQWTDFAVMDLESGFVRVIARKGSVNVTEAGKTDRLEAGRDVTRASCVAEQRERERSRKKGGAATAASTGPLNSTAAIYGGAAAAGGIAIFVLTRPRPPVSPDKP
jgi:ferric-dicitrate binding protein FerR (iron transport regulator)